MSRRGGRKSSNHKEALADDSAVSASEDESSAHDHDHDQPGQKKSDAKRRSKALNSHNKDSPKPTKKKEEDTEKKKDHEEGPNNKKEEEENSKQQAHNLKRVGALLKKPKLVTSKWHHKGKKGKEEAAPAVEHRIPSPREERKECEHGMECQEIDPQHFINFAHTPNAHRTKAEAANCGDPLAQKKGEEKEEEKQEEETKTTTTTTTKVEEEPEEEAKEMEENVVDKDKEEDNNEEQLEEEEKPEKENEEEEAKRKVDEEKERNGILAKEEKVESSNEEEDKNNEEGEKGAAVSSEETASSSESAEGNKSEKEDDLLGTPMNYAHHRLTKTSFKSLGSQFRRNTVTSLIDPSPLPPSMRKMTIQEQKADYRKSMGPFAMRNYKEDGSVRTFADVVSPDVLATISVTERRRQDVIFELITTEQQYVQDLHILVDVFLKPVRQRQFLNKMEQAMIFSNVEALLDVNSALLEDLFRRQKENIVVERVGDILVERSDLFKLYAVYCSNQPIIMTELTKLKTKYPPFKEFLDEAFRNPQCRLLELHSFLIHPLQRICKYPLLLKELLKNTPEDHPDHKDLKEALERISEVVDLINERTRQVKNVADVTEIENSIQGGEVRLHPRNERRQEKKEEKRYQTANQTRRRRGERTENIEGERRERGEERQREKREREGERERGTKKVKPFHSRLSKQKIGPQFGTTRPFGGASSRDEVLGPERSLQAQRQMREPGRPQRHSPHSKQSQRGASRDAALQALRSFGLARTSGETRGPSSRPFHQAQHQKGSRARPTFRRFIFHLRFGQPEEERSGRFSPLRGQNKERG
ncbi:Rho guanine nucleotide exchange factor (GEF) 17, variant 3 [Balamuthia mandrillaris]